MDIQLPHAQQSAIENLIASGRFESAQEAVSEGVRLLVGNEKLRQAVQIGIDQADAGDLHDHDTVFAQLKSMVADPSN